MKMGDGKIITNGDMSGNIVSVATLLAQVYGYSVQAVWGGGTAPTGTFTLEASNDLTDKPGDVVNWDTVTGSSLAISADGTYMWNFNGAFYRWVRLKYVRTSGNGTLNAILVTKGV